MGRVGGKELARAVEGRVETLERRMETFERLMNSRSRLAPASRSNWTNSPVEPDKTLPAAPLDARKAARSASMSGRVRCHVFELTNITRMLERWCSY